MTLLDNAMNVKTKHFHTALHLSENKHYRAPFRAASRTGLPASSKQTRSRQSAAGQKLKSRSRLVVSRYCKMIPLPQPGTDLQIILSLALKELGLGWKITASPKNLPNLCKDVEGKLTICCVLEQLKIRTLVPIPDFNSAGSRNVFISTNFVFRESHTTIIILNPHSVLCTIWHFLINTNMLHKLVEDLDIQFVFYSFGSL